MQQIIYDANPHFIWRKTQENRKAGSLVGFNHYDDSMVITCLFRGTGNLWVEGHNTRMEEGDLLLLNPQEFHRGFFDAHPRHERLSIYIHHSIADGFPIEGDSLFSAFFDRVPGQYNVIPARILQALRIRQLLESMRCPEDGYGAVLLQCQVLQMMLLLKQAVKLAQALPAHSITNKSAARAIEYINRHLTEDVTTASIAEALFIDKSYLCRVFKKYTGATISDYVSQKRVDYAARLLAEGATCADACYRSGFSNYSSFYRYYKRYKGSIPKEK